MQGEVSESGTYRAFFAVISLFDGKLVVPEQCSRTFYGVEEKAPSWADSTLYRRQSFISIALDHARLVSESAGGERAYLANHFSNYVPTQLSFFDLFWPGESRFSLRLYGALHSQLPTRRILLSSLSAREGLLYEVISFDVDLKRLKDNVPLPLDVVKLAYYRKPLASAREDKV